MGSGCDLPSVTLVVCEKTAKVSEEAAEQPGKRAGAWPDPHPPPPLPRTCTRPSAQDNGNTVPQLRAGWQPPPAKAPAWRGEERVKYPEVGAVHSRAKNSRGRAASRGEGESPLYGHFGKGP